MATNYSDILEPTIDISDLTFHEIVGRGSSGEVYRATWKSKDFGEVETAAKKIPIIKSQGISKELENEIRFLRTLEHPSIIKFNGLALEPNHVVLVTEYAPNGSLLDYLKDKTELPPNLKAKWRKQIAHGIKYLRDKDVLHRDIKSPNLLITIDLNLKICDFGISKELTSTKTTVNPDRGSIKWQAPEIFKDRKLSPKADVFALCVVFWELETCEEPYKGDDNIHIMYIVGKNDKRPTIPKTCPETTKSLIQKCWHKKRSKRPTIEDVVDQLEEQDIAVRRKTPKSKQGEMNGSAGFSSMLRRGKKGLSGVIRTPSKPVIHGSYDNGLCFPDSSGLQYPTYDDEEFKNGLDKVSLNGHVFGPTQPYHYVNTNQHLPKVTVNCNNTAALNHFDGDQQIAWVSTCVENEPRLQSIEPEPVVHIKKDFVNLDTCYFGPDSGIREYPSTDIQSISQVSFTDEI